MKRTLREHLRDVADMFGDFSLGLVGTFAVAFLFWLMILSVRG